MTVPHTFHIPVMGTAFSIDTPIKVAHYGISSVISLVDDTLIEEMRKIHCDERGLTYEPITKYDNDYRARRITAYLNLVDEIVKQQFESVRNSAFAPGTEITKYFEMLPDRSSLKKKYRLMLDAPDGAQKEALQKELRGLMRAGDINVNIMTKVDRNNFAGREELPAEFSDALSALRGYAKSTLVSGIVFSAGINRRLYSYVEQFKDFYADTSGAIRKKIILKVSDYRSSLIQGRFFAKKGLWISEYRVESGLNCGGHAFASDGFLMGPILEEFRRRKQELMEGLNGIYVKALETLDKPVPGKILPVAITAQGGIGTAAENDFLFDYYKLNATGWGTPFLLVPEATNVDEETLAKLCGAGEKDLYLSDISPLGVPFNNLRDNASDLEKERRAATGKPGSACPKGHLVSNVEFTEEPICTASRLYQKLKVDQLKTLNLDDAEYKRRYDAVTVKACICNDLGEAALIKHHVEKRGVKRFSAICPGPNLAYFSKVVTLQEMVDHIYGRINILNDTYRMNMFVKELKLYIDYFVKEVGKQACPDDKRKQYLNEFCNNMLDGIEYYRQLFPKMLEDTEERRRQALQDLKVYKSKLDSFIDQHRHIFVPATEMMSI